MCKKIKKDMLEHEGIQCAPFKGIIESIGTWEVISLFGFKIIAWYWGKSRQISQAFKIIWESDLDFWN